jgi:hypothetical protein
MATERDHTGKDIGNEAAGGVSRRRIIKGGAAAIAAVGAGALQAGCAQSPPGPAAAPGAGQAFTRTAVGQALPANFGASPYFRALVRMAEYTREGNAAARVLLLRQISDNSADPRVHASLAYNYLQDYRNGWDDVADNSGLEAALAEAEKGVALDTAGSDYFAHWALAFVHRYRGRTHAESVVAALGEYHLAKTFAEKEAASVMRDLETDFAEYMIYLLMPDDAVSKIDSSDIQWHDWVLAFANHQNKNPAASIELLAPYSPFKAPEYNDMYLVLGASYYRNGQSAEAQACIEAFQGNRPASEPAWTAALERERGCFVMGDAEDYWIDSLTGAGLPEA